MVPSPCPSISTAPRRRPLDPRVRAEMLRYLDDDFGNAGSRTHELGTARPRGRRAGARSGCGRRSAARRGDVIFTSGATESNNLAILGLAGGAGDRQAHRVDGDRASRGARAAGRARAARVRGHARPARRRWRGRSPTPSCAAVRPDTLLVSMMHVNNETGVMQPIAEVADRLTASDAYLHVDAAQSFGRSSTALRHPRIDLISVSAHKINGPKGVGALSLRRRGRATPAAAAADVRRRPGARAASGHAAGAADRRIRAGRRAGGRGSATRAPRGAARSASRCSPAWRRSTRSSTAIPRGRCPTSSTCRFPASTPRPRSTRGASWSRSRTARPARRRATPAATS